jgi:hypothetical protein
MGSNVRMRGETSVVDGQYNHYYSISKIVGKDVIQVPHLSHSTRQYQELRWELGDYSTPYTLAPSDARAD